MKYVIGIVGGIACGKSYISNLLKENHNATIINADYIAHLKLETEYVTSALMERWGQRFGLLSFSGSTKEFRTEVAKIVFNNKKELKFFEKLMWPLIKEDILWAIRYTEGLIVLDMPLLFEAKMDKYCDNVWYVSLDREKRIINFSQRYTKAKKPIDEILKDFKSREERQIDCTEKMRRADQIIFNVMYTNVVKDMVEDTVRMIGVKNKLKLCKDCEWCLPDNSFKDKEKQYKFASCVCPRNLNCPSCKIQRQQDWFSSLLMEMCGKSGKWFELKGEKDGRI